MKRLPINPYDLAWGYLLDMLTESLDEDGHSDYELELSVAMDCVKCMQELSKRTNERTYDAFKDIVEKAKEIGERY